MKTNFSRKTINTYIYLKNHVINNKSADKQVHMMKVSNNKNLFKSYCFFYILFNLLEGKPEKPIFQMRKYANTYGRYLPKKQWKTLNIIFYDIHYQFNCSGYNFTMIATIWIEQPVHHPFLFNRSSEETNRTQELGWNLGK